MAAFEAVVADRQHGEFQSAFTDADRSADSSESWEKALGSLFGPSGFMYVFAIDFGTLLGWYGNPQKAKMYIYGNPIVAETMLRHDIRVAGPGAAADPHLRPATARQGYGYDLHVQHHEPLRQPGAGRGGAQA